MAGITLEEVEHVALLARLRLSPEEKVRLADELSAVMAHFQALQETDTTDVPPTAHPLQRENVLRDDVRRDSLPREEFLAAAPDSRDEFFVVPRVVDN